MRLERFVAHAYLGAIAVLIFGMKMTSEALQKMAGPYADALVARQDSVILFRNNSESNQPSTKTGLFPEGPVAGLSSFLSNTTVVALFVNIVKMWSKKLGISPSKLLIPLSYASGMGGVCTLIGSPTHMLVYGPGGYRFSDFIRIGLPMNFIILAANIFIVNVLYPLTPLL